MPFTDRLKGKLRQRKCVYIYSFRSFLLVHDGLCTPLTACLDSCYILFYNVSYRIVLYYIA